MDNGASTSLGDESAAEMEDHLLQAMEMDDPNKFIKDLPCGFGYRFASVFIFIVMQKDLNINKSVLF